MEWSWMYAVEVFPRILPGILVTIQATLVGSILAIGVGVILMLLIKSRWSWLRVATREVTDFIRGTPILVQLYVVFFTLSDFGVTLSGFVAGVLTIGLHYGAFLSEVFRAGYDSVPRTQWEAAKALNLSKNQTLRRVIFPQAIVPILPAVGNYILGMFKETPLLSTVTVIEMLAIARGIAATEYRFFEPYFIVGFLFLVVSLPCAFALRLLEQKQRHSIEGE